MTAITDENFLRTSILAHLLVLDDVFLRHPIIKMTPYQIDYLKFVAILRS